ncbi:MAG: serine/threonine protein kinase [Desulfobacteraceae bacterium]|nr:serine/threonine protein kinase [Desulfobacteraceae bacterium]MBU3948948.1 serine/threonine protein kinase [Pseudomonadota bacterium]
MDSKAITRIEWQKSKTRLFTYDVTEFEDSGPLDDNVVWRGEEWLREYTAYPDGSGIEPANLTLLHFLLEQYNIPTDILPIESVRHMSPEKLESLQEQISALGGPDRFKAIISKIEQHGFKIQGYLGAGGWGIVFHMLRSTDHATVALKILKPPYSEEWRKRFLREVEILSLLANDLRLGGLLGAPFDVDGLMCLPIRFISGRPLSELALPINTRDALEIVCDVLSVLDTFHKKGVIHRDLHLGNVILGSDGALVVVDFGVARQEQVTDYTYTFRPVGAMSHCAPEKWTDPSTVGAPSDVFSVGVMLYRLLTSKFPFWAESYIRLYEQIRNGRFTDVSEANPNVPPFINIVLKSLLEPDRQQRPGKASEALTMVGHAKALVDLDERQRRRRHSPQQSARRGRT